MTLPSVIVKAKHPEGTTMPNTTLSETVIRMKRERYFFERNRFFKKRKRFFKNPLTNEK